MSRLYNVCIVRTLEIDAAHRVFGHEGKCKDVHGHRYKFNIYARAPELDSLGRVIDFSVIKQRIGSYIDNNWDHGTFLYEKDPLVEIWATEKAFWGMKYFVMDANPTAENIAKALLMISNQLMYNTEVQIHRIECFETPNNMAYAELS